jgi:hypothetical protein
MILSTQGFTGVLCKWAVKGHPLADIKMTIKHNCEGEIQNFLDNMEKEFNLESISSLFSGKVLWDKLILCNDINFPVTVEFDEVEFDANLVSVTVKRSMKEGSESYEYSMVFQKEVAADNLDKVLQTEYLNRKDEDEDGKMKTTLFQVKIRKQEKKDDSPLS